MTCDIGASTPEWEMETQKYKGLLIVALASKCETETRSQETLHKSGPGGLYMRFG